MAAGKLHTIILSAAAGVDTDTDIYVVTDQLPPEDDAVATKCQNEAEALFKSFRASLPIGTVAALMQNMLVEEVMTDNGCRVMSQLREIQEEAGHAKALHLHTNDEASYIFDVLTNGDLPAKTRNELGKLFLAVLLQGSLPEEIWQFVERVADWWLEPEDA